MTIKWADVTPEQAVEKLVEIYANAKAAQFSRENDFAKQANIADTLRQYAVPLGIGGGALLGSGLGALTAGDSPRKRRARAITGLLAGGLLGGAGGVVAPGAIDAFQNAGGFQGLLGGAQAALAKTPNPAAAVPPEDARARLEQIDAALAADPTATRPQWINDVGRAATDVGKSLYNMVPGDGQVGMLASGLGGMWAQGKLGIDSLIDNLIQHKNVRGKDLYNFAKGTSEEAAKLFEKRPHLKSWMLNEANRSRQPGGSRFSTSARPSTLDSLASAINKTTGRANNVAPGTAVPTPITDFTDKHVQQPGGAARVKGKPTGNAMVAQNLHDATVRQSLRQGALAARNAKPGFGVQAARAGAKGVLPMAAALGGGYLLDSYTDWLNNN